MYFSHFLLQYHNYYSSCHTGVSPTELLLGPRPRSLLYLALPSVSSLVTDNQESKSRPIKKAKNRSFAIGDMHTCSLCWDFPSWKSWLSKKIDSICGPVTYVCDKVTCKSHSTAISFLSNNHLTTPLMELPDIRTITITCLLLLPIPQTKFHLHGDHVFVPPNQYDPSSF